jgi:hypothetical protein
VVLRQRFIPSRLNETGCVEERWLSAQYSLTAYLPMNATTEPSTSSALAALLLLGWHVQQRRIGQTFERNVPKLVGSQVANQIVTITYRTCSLVGHKTRIASKRCISWWSHYEVSRLGGRALYSSPSWASRYLTGCCANGSPALRTRSLDFPVVYHGSDLIFHNTEPGR